MYSPVIAPTIGSVEPHPEILEKLFNIHIHRGRGDIIVVAWNSSTNKGCAASQKQYGVEYRRFNVKDGFLHYLGTRRKLSN